MSSFRQGLLGSGVMGIVLAVAGCAMRDSASVIPTNSSLASVRSVDTSHVSKPATAKAGDVMATLVLVNHQGGAREAEGVETLPLLTVVAGGLTLDEAINTCLLADPKIRAGLEVINQANADLGTSSLLPNPTLLTDGIFLPFRRFTPERPGGPPQMDVQLGYSIDWFLFGKRAAAMASATVGVNQSEADYADLVRKRVTDTALAFYDVLEAKGLLDFARKDLENLRQVESATKKAVDAGGKPLVELNRARLDLLKSEQSLREAETTLGAAKAKLRALMGRGDADPSFDIVGDLDAPLAKEPLPVEDALTAAEQNRPDIQSLRLQIAKADADVLVERRKAFPQVTPAFTLSRQFQTTLGSPDANSWDVSLTMPLPLFDRNQGNRAKARSILAQNAFNLESGLVELRSEIVQAVEEFEKAHKIATSVASEQVKIATDVKDSITKAYDAGGRTLLEVLDAQRSYRDTYRLYINSRANYWRALHKLNSAMGKQVLQ